MTTVSFREYLNDKQAWMSKHHHNFEIYTYNLDGAVTRKDLVAGDGTDGRFVEFTKFIVVPGEYNGFKYNTELKEVEYHDEENDTRVFYSEARW